LYGFTKPNRFGLPDLGFGKRRKMDKRLISKGTMNGPAIAYLMAASDAQALR
jgi:hypothetical protein